ncbi:hypothetical protein E4U14_004815, partial [Claviceps sp. LM454 group G7]
PPRPPVITTVETRYNDAAVYAPASTNDADALLAAPPDTPPPAPVTPPDSDTFTPTLDT